MLPGLSPFAIPAAFTAAAMLLFAAWIALRHFSRTGAAMASLYVAAAGWEAACALTAFAADARAALLWTRIGCAFLPFVFAGAYQVFATLIDGTHHRRIVSGLGWLVAAQLAIMTVATDHIVDGAHPRLTVTGLALCLLTFGGFTAAAVVEFVRAYPKSMGTERERLRLFAIALSLAGLVVVDLFLFPIGWAALLASAAVAMISVRKDGLVPITPSLAATQIISTMRDLLLVCDRDGRIRFANQAACAFLGCTPEEIIGRRLEEIVVPTDGNAAPLQGWTRDREYVFRTKMGQPIELTLSHSPVTHQGETTGAVIIGRDLRERKRYEWEARRAVTLLESTLDSTADGILVIGADGRVLTWNQRFIDMWGIPSELLEHDDQGLIGHLIDRLSDPAELLRTLAALHEHPEVESVHVLELKDGRRLEQYSIGRMLDDEPLRVWSFRDVTARLAAEEQIAFHAYHDELTQLPNRRRFVEQLELSLLRARRARMSVAVLFIDLDRFKIINDTLGHSVADALLVEIARRLRSCVRETDTVARHGGDEFTVILPDLRQPEDAAQVAEKILECIREPIAAGTAAVEVTVSIGIAVCPHDGADVDTLLRNADDAMYRAKEAGRNTAQLCTEQMKRRAGERLSLQARLRKAMAADALVLAYQPQVSLAAGTIVGAEALIRWNDPERGVIEPRDFIPAAEETRLIVPLGEWALWSACRQLRRWRDAGLPPLRMAVNISARHFQQRDLAHVVRRVIDDCGIDPRWLELEIPETAAMRDVDLAIGLINLLRDAGVSVAIDDFGSAYSSLGSLRLLPIDAVKMDRHLEPVIVGAVIGVTREFGLRVAADGVETRQQLELLQSRGCHEAQGTYFSPALEPDAFALLASSEGWLDRVSS